MSTVYHSIGTFSGQFAGRDGYIVYREESKELQIGWELSGSTDCDVSVGPLDFTKWTIPAGERIPEEKQLEILTGFRSWLSKQKLRSNVDLPDPILEESAPCAWQGCSSRKIRTSAYCWHHFDLMCLRR